MTTTHIIPRTRTVMIEHKIHIIECAGCSIDFGIGDDFRDRRRKDHETFYCPNGCSNHYPEPSELEKKATRLERELEAARSLANREAQRRQSAVEAAKRADYRTRAAKGQLTKTKKRIAAGVCPCCNRTFQNLGSHMAGQHPDYVEGGNAQ